MLRIFPLYLTFVVLATLIAPALKLTTPHEAAVLRGSQGWYWSYLVNAMIADANCWGRRCWLGGYMRQPHLMSLQDTRRSAGESTAGPDQQARHGGGRR